MLTHLHPLSSPATLDLFSNHRKAVRLLFLRALMHAGLNYRDACARLRNVQVY